MSVIASLFDFPYRSKDIYECIKDTETSLRHLISKVMNQQFGSEWLYDSQRGFAAKDLEEVRKRKKHETAEARNSRFIIKQFT